MSTQIEIFDTNQSFEIDLCDSKESRQDISREDYTSQAWGFWSPWQMRFGENVDDMPGDLINLKEEYQWLTCYIWLPEEYNVTDIDPDTILLNGRVRAACFEIKGELQLLIANFSWSQVKRLLELGEFEFTVGGQLLNGAPFDCSDTVTVKE
jgi:hypothetical protein